MNILDTKDDLPELATQVRKEIKRLLELRESLEDVDFGPSSHDLVDIPLHNRNAFLERFVEATPRTLELTVTIIAANFLLQWAIDWDFRRSYLDLQHARKILGINDLGFSLRISDLERVHEVKQNFLSADVLDCARDWAHERNADRVVVEKEHVDSLIRKWRQLLEALRFGRIYHANEILVDYPELHSFIFEKIW